jgi:hypothetical protein
MTSTQVCRQRTWIPACLLSVAAALLAPASVMGAEVKANFRVSVEVVEPCSIGVAAQGVLQLGCAADALRSAPSAVTPVGQVQGARVDEVWCLPMSKAAARLDDCSAAPSAARELKIVSVTF